VAAVVSRPAWRMLVLLIAQCQQFNKRALLLLLLVKW